MSLSPCNDYARKATSLRVVFILWSAGALVGDLVPEVGFEPTGQPTV
jgi:hypothetical protein